MSKETLLSPADIDDIVAIIDGTSYEQIEITTNRFTLRVRRSGEGWTQDWTSTRDQLPATGETPAGSDAGPDDRSDDDGTVSVASPLPGVFYRSPQPGAPPFVDIGQTVAPETVIGIIEIMKLMNPVLAGVAGTIARWTAENGEQVDGGQVLMRVTPDAA